MQRCQGKVPPRQGTFGAGVSKEIGKQKPGSGRGKQDKKIRMVKIQTRFQVLPIERRTQTAVFLVLQVVRSY